MLEPAGLLFDFSFIVDPKSFREQPFRQAMAADDVFGTLAAFLRENDHAFAMSGKISAGTKRHVTAIQHLLVNVRFRRMRRQIDQAAGAQFKTNRNGRPLPSA